MEILKFPNPHLFLPCKEVTVFGSELKTLLDSMWDTMTKHSGLGLASNQVGLEYRMFTMVGPEKEKMYIVNPKIILKSKVPANFKEGCLSAPGEFILLRERTMWVQMIYQDETGAIHSGTFSGMHAVCVQHEIDHLDGKSHLQSKSIPRAKRRQIFRKWGVK